MSDNANGITIRTAKGGDSAILHALAASCPPLTLHTAFTYWVIVFNYPEYIFIAELDGVPVGFISALPTAARDGVYVWQVGVLPARRGRGIAGALARALLRAHRAHRRFIVTIDPGNDPSMATFRSLAADHGTALAEWTDKSFAVDADILARDDNERVLAIVLPE